MPEIKKEVKTFNVEYICDSCGNGKMVDTGCHYWVEDTLPESYVHECDACGDEKGFTCKYPGTKTVIIQESD